MNRLFCVIVSLVLAGCASAPPPAPVPEGDARFVVDPRIGYATIPPVLEKRFDAAWRAYLLGDYDDARRRFNDLKTKNPDLAPAHLGLAAIAIRQGDLSEAARHVTAARGLTDAYAAADIFEAEIALARGDLRKASELYRRVATRSDVPAAIRDRLADIETRLFGEIYQSALSASDADSIALLREALALNPGASGARLLLARRLITLNQHEEARRVLDPLVNSTDVDRPEVQELLAEIEVARGRYEEAIARLDRLTRRDSDPRFRRRLEEVKVLWNAANMPPQFQEALRSEAITRTDFATLLYWKVASIRFAQNVPAPPIAVDISDVPGRDEMVRAIAIGIFQVDPVTREVGPHRLVTASAFTRLTARALLARGAACARQVGGETNELARAQKIVAACGLTQSVFSLLPDAPVSGSTAAEVLDELDRAMAR